MTSALEGARAAQEQAITAPAPAFVHACPGAGKTHVIVSRHLRAPDAVLRGGRALLSFTRAAATQMRSRCHREGRPETTAFPHYIGTLDAFIWDVLVEPHHPASHPLQRLDSWDRVQAEVKLDRQIPLSAFTFQRDPYTGRESIRKDLLKAEYRHHIDQSERSWASWEKAAFEARKAQYEAGYVTGHETRLFALKYLDRGEIVANPLRSRFAEIIVDEAQDCSVTDLEILDRLHNVGIPLVVVADPDQMIYGWRDADLGRLSTLTGKLGQTVPLNGNWRSSTTVCHLATTLRAGSRPPDLAVRPPDREPPVILLPAQFPKGQPARHTVSQQPVVDIFLGHAQSHGIAPGDCLVTAYQKTHLPTRTRRSAGNLATRLAHAWHAIHSGSADPDVLNEAFLIAGRFLLRYWYPHLAVQGSLPARCALADIEYGDLVRHAYAFLYALPEPHDGWPSDVNSKLKTWPRPPKSSPKGATGQLRTKPESIAASDTTGRCRIANIAQVKGDEHAAVLLLLPDSDARTRWIHGNPDADELLRNWYVAVTRARKLIAVGMRMDQLDDLAKYLEARQIPIFIG